MNKKTIKIDFRNFLTDPSGKFDKRDNFFYKMLKKDYRVIIDEKNPEYVFFSTVSPQFLGHEKKSSFAKENFPGIYKFFREKIFLPYIKNSELWQKKMRARFIPIEGNFVKIFYTIENVVPDMEKCDWAFSFCYDEEFKHPRHLRLPFYFYEGFGKSLVKKNLDFEKIKREKTGFCNFIYSNDVYFRNLFFKKLSMHKRVDAPGKCMNNMPPIGNYSDPMKSRMKSNCFDEKIDFLKKYKFTIAFENSAYPGYTTEKIAQPMSVDSIPIYFGNPLIYRDFNPKSFINVRDFKNMEDAIKRIMEIDKDDNLYRQILNEPWFPNNEPTKYVSKEALRKRFKKIFG
jgi:hypothetical protein